MPGNVSKLGDFRTGSITGVVGGCGKPNCHCAGPQDASRSPGFGITYKVNGKKRAESLPIRAVLHKTELKLAESRRFRQHAGSPDQQPFVAHPFILPFIWSSVFR